MRHLVTLVFSLILINSANAENWICYDDQNIITTKVQGDCLKLGLCTGFNNEGLRPDCFEASKNEYEKAASSQVKVDKGIIVGDRVVDLTEEEKQDQKRIEDEVKLENENNKRSLIDKLKGLGLSDEEISLLIN